MLSKMFRLALVLAATAFPAAAAAQSDSPARPGFAAGANVVWTDLSGPAFDMSSSGFGGELTGRYTWLSGFQIVAGAHYNLNSVNEIGDDIGLLMIFADGRYVFRLFDSQRVGPFIGGRVAYAHTTLGERDADGLGISGLVGFLFELLPTLAIEASGYFGGLWLSREIIPDLPPRATNPNGSLATVEVGIVWSAS